MIPGRIRDAVLGRRLLDLLDDSDVEPAGFGSPEGMAAYNALITGRARAMFYVGGRLRAAVGGPCKVRLSAPRGLRKVGTAAVYAAMGLVSPRSLEIPAGSVEMIRGEGARRVILGAASAAARYSRVGGLHVFAAAAAAGQTCWEYLGAQTSDSVEVSLRAILGGTPGRFAAFAGGDAAVLAADGVVLVLREWDDVEAYACERWTEAAVIAGDDLIDSVALEALDKVPPSLSPAHLAMLAAAVAALESASRAVPSWLRHPPTWLMAGAPPGPTTVTLATP